MNKKDNTVLAVAFLVGVLAGLLLAINLESGWWKAKAVEQGHAEWYLNGDSAEWRWKECPECEGVDQ